MTARRASRQSSQTPDWVDILLAATLASWSVMMSFALAAALLGLLFDFDTRAAPSLGLLLPTAFFGFFIALFVCVLLGLPILALANVFKLNAWWQGALLGSAAGWSVSFVMLGGLASMYAPGVAPFSLALVVAGAVAGVAAWRERRKGFAP